MNWKKVWFLGACLVGSLIQADIAKVEALVLDDRTGEPMKDVSMMGIFEMRNGWGAWKGSPLPNEEYALTDATGRCRLWGRTNNGGAGVAVKDAPPGYYCPRRGQGWTFPRRNLLGIWQPDNLVATIRLQRVEHPIPLLVKSLTGLHIGASTEDVFPKGENVLRYDLFVGDWLPPVGTGVVADVVFTRNPHEDLGEGRNGDTIRGRAYRDSMTVSFPGDGNGLVEFHPDSSLCLKIRTAPEDGYRPDYTCWKMKNLMLQPERSYDENRCFCFRIRTRRDAEGRIVEAYYGKIYRDISFLYQFRPYLPVACPWMSYYLNPTSLDRNLEWDRKTNLFAPRRKIWNPNDEYP